jgi:hypothetical protein
MFAPSNFPFFLMKNKKEDKKNPKKIYFSHISMTTERHLCVGYGNVQYLYTCQCTRLNAIDVVACVAKVSFTYFRCYFQNSDEAM